MQEFVTIVVSKDPSTNKFRIHREFACHHSPVFKAAFNSDFQEGKSQIYILEDPIEGAVQLLVQWLIPKN